MKQIIILLALTLISFLSYSNDIQETWNNFDKEYLNSIANKDYERALEIAFEMDSMEPSNSQILLYIVYAHIKLERELPEWVMEYSWSNSNSQETLNRLIAEHLLSNN